MTEHIHKIHVPTPDDEKHIEEMSKIFKVISDPTRIRILSLLAHQEEQCVKEIVTNFSECHLVVLSKNAISTV